MKNAEGPGGADHRAVEVRLELPENALLLVALRKAREERDQARHQLAQSQIQRADAVTRLLEVRADLAAARARIAELGRMAHTAAELAAGPLEPTIEEELQCHRRLREVAPHLVQLHDAIGRVVGP
jgi:hypothetical protein